MIFPTEKKGLEDIRETLPWQCLAKGSMTGMKMIITEN